MGNHYRTTPPKKLIRFNLRVVGTTVVRHRQLTRMLNELKDLKDLHNEILAHEGKARSSRQKGRPVDKLRAHIDQLTADLLRSRQELEVSKSQHRDYVRLLQESEELRRQRDHLASEVEGNDKERRAFADCRKKLEAATIEITRLKKAAEAQRYRFPYRSLTEVEQRFCTENGISHRFALGDQFDDQFVWRRDPLWIREGRGFNSEKVLQQIDAVEIRGKYRFANAVIALCNAISFAQAFGIPMVYHPGFTFIQDGPIDDRITLTSGVDDSNNAILSGWFYNKTLKALDSQPLSRLACTEKLRPLFNFNISDWVDQDGDALCIHFRSGDIFEKATPHPDYGQPPLAFYKKIINHKEWRAIQFVYENGANPTIQELKSFICSKNIPLEIHSGSLESDLAVISKARHLVIGRGTFIYPIICLSRNIKTVYCFEQHALDEWGLGSQVNVRLIRDVGGAYVNDIYICWKNSADQIRLMLEYPEENLAMI